MLLITLFQEVNVLDVTRTITIINVFDEDYIYIFFAFFLSPRAFIIAFACLLSFNGVRACLYVYFIQLLNVTDAESV